MMSCYAQTESPLDPACAKLYSRERITKKTTQYTPLNEERYAIRI